MSTLFPLASYNSLTYQFLQHGELHFWLVAIVDIHLLIFTHCAGYPGCEHQIRAALTETIGQEKSDFFFDKVCLPDSEPYTGRNPSP
jgi:hypothetical protein